MTEGWVNDTAWFGISFFGVTAVEGSTVLPVSVKKKCGFPSLRKLPCSRKQGGLRKSRTQGNLHLCCCHVQLHCREHLEKDIWSSLPFFFFGGLGSVRVAVGLDDL